MTSEIAVRVSTNGGTAAQGVATDVSGHAVEISVLSGTSRRVFQVQEVRSGAEVRMVFLSKKHGASPSIRGVVQTASRSPQSLRLSVEVQDWDKLARFWEGVRRR